MRRTQYKPSKPVAIVGILVGIGMLGFGIAGFGDADGGVPAFLVFWCAAVVGITALNTWAAFSEKGSLGTFVSDDDDAEQDRPKPFL
jgi:hypothetical protein